MESRRFSRRAPKILALDLDSVLALLSERETESIDSGRELAEEVAYLREAVQDLESVLTQACESLGEVVTLLRDRLYPAPFPEPLRDGPLPQRQELSSNGLVDFAQRDDDPPF